MLRISRGGGSETEFNNESGSAVIWGQAMQVENTSGGKPAKPVTDTYDAYYYAGQNPMIKLLLNVIRMGFPESWSDTDRPVLDNGDDGSVKQEVDSLTIELHKGGTGEIVKFTIPLSDSANEIRTKSTFDEVLSTKRKPTNNEK